MTTEDQANALLKAAEEATPGEWGYEDPCDSGCWRYCDPNGCPETHPTGTYVVYGPNWVDDDESRRIKNEGDAAFIALARNTAPAIASALLEKQKALEGLRDELKSLQAQNSATAPDYDAPDDVWADWRSLCLDRYEHFAQAFLARQGETA